MSWPKLQKVLCVFISSGLEDCNAKLISSLLCPHIVQIMAPRFHAPESDLF